MPRRYKDHPSIKPKSPAWFVYLPAVVFLIAAVACTHAVMMALEQGREDWWLGVVALAITACVALRFALFRRQSNAR